jgi:hypothetical protein
MVATILRSPSLIEPEMVLKSSFEEILVIRMF